MHNFLALLHTNKNGSNDAALQKLIQDGRSGDSTVRQRFLLNRFDKLSSTEKSDLIDNLRRALGVSLTDTKTDVSSSYATTDFVAKIFKPEVLYATRQHANEDQNVPFS